MPPKKCTEKGCNGVLTQWYGPGMLALPPQMVCLKCGKKKEVR